MIVELHCHTSEHSACSYVNAVELIKRAANLEMQGIVITDHHYKWNQEDLDAVKEKSGVPEIFCVLAGQEFKTSDYGDVLVYGAAETIKKGSLKVEELRKEYPDAAIVWAHPYRHNKIPHKEKLLNPHFDAIEIFSSNYTAVEAARALKDWHELKFTAIAGTDTHALSYTGSYPTLFDHPFSSIEEMAVEIKEGRCRPYFKETPRTGTTNTKIMQVSIGAKKSEDRKKIIVKTFEDMEAWKEGERTHYIVKEISKHDFNAGKYRVSLPIDKDRNTLSIIEEQIDGILLHDILLKSGKEEAEKYLTMTAHWLAKLHNLNLKITPDEEYLQIEKERLEYYMSSLFDTDHEHKDRINQIKEDVWKNETELIKSSPEILVQSHGDFHLKNIFVGKDSKTNEEYIAVIDFNSSYNQPRAFDVGSFIAQYRNMYFDNPEVYYKAPVEIFFREYVNASENLPPDFEAQVQLYKTRTYLSIIYYLVKVGKGNSENFWTILIEAERSLAHMAYNKVFVD